MSSENSMISDRSNCYNKIIDCYLRNKHDYHKLEDCKNKSILSLMKILRQSNDQAFVENALIFVLSLFNRSAPPDLYSSLGTDSKKCNNEEKEILISLLKEEFL